MAVSHTKENTITNRTQNPFLQAAALQPVQEVDMDLGSDHPSFPPEESILDGAINALKDKQTHYVDVPGILPLREAISGFLGEAGYSQFNRDVVQVTAGMQEGRFLTLQNIGDRQPAVAVPEVVHPGVLKALGVRPLRVVRLPVDSERLLPTVDGIKNTLENGCRMIFLESPSRLTGAVYSPAEVQQITGLVNHHAADLLWDQGMSPWVKSDYVSAASLPEGQDHVTIMGELWPGIGLERLYLGFIAGPEKWMKVIKTQKQVLSICTNAQIQFAALEALPVYREKFALRKNLLAENHQKAKDALNGLGFEALTGSTVNLLAFRAPAAVHAKLTGLGYRIVDGKDFGAEGVLRISITPQGTELAALKML